MKINELLKNSTRIFDDVFLVKSAAKEARLLSSDQIWRGGSTIVVKYGSTRYVKITDGSKTFSDLPKLGQGGGGGGGDADTLQGQNGAYYRNRANHTGSQAISTVTGLQTALNAKADTSSLGTAAAADVEDFATASQGELADSAVQPDGLPTWSTISGKPAFVAEGSDAAAARTALGLGTAATQDTSAFATSTQGGKADTAVQTLVEGSNITIDNTDPQNPVISATGELSGTEWGDITGTLSDQTDLNNALTAKADTSALSGYVPTSRTVNGKALSANIDLTNTDVGAAATSHTHAAGDVTSGTFDTERIPDLATSKITGLDTALSGKLDVGTGTQNSSTFRRGDGTWATPTDTTYSAISQTDIENPASTTAGLITGQRLSQGIAHKSNNLVTIVGESGSTLNYGLNHIGLDKVVRTTGGGNKTHTVVPQATTTWPDGAVIQLATPSSEVTIEAGDGVNIIADQEAPWVIAANTMASIIRLGSNEWILAAKFKEEE